MTRGFNVVFMGNFPYPHGLAGTKRVQTFIDYLCSINIIPKVLVLRQGGEQVAKSQLHGYHKSVYYKTIGYGINLGGSVIFKLPLYFLLGTLSLLKWRSRYCTNYLYCYNGLDVENLFFVLLAKAAGYRVIFDVVEDFSHLQHQPHLLAKLKNKSWVFLDEHIVRLADGVVAISKYLKNKYEQRNRKQIPIQLIPISARCAGLELKRKISTVDPFKFAYSGSFAEKDDVFTLIKAFELVQKSRQNCELLLSGKGGRMEIEKVKEKIRAHPSIKYIGYLPDSEFYQFLGQADVLCMTRTNSAYANAGFPFKLGEYLATGKPVIASNIGDVSTYLNDREDALLTDAGDIDGLVTAMRYCIDNYEKAVELGRKGLEKCQKYFNPEINGKLLMELMSKLQDNR